MDKAGKLVREDSRRQQHDSSTDHDAFAAEDPTPRTDCPENFPAGAQIYITEPITDRKSVFVGRACRIHHPSEVTLLQVAIGTMLIWLRKRYP